MKHRIDPKVDCVFKSLLGKEENSNLLIHFLNAVLEPPKGMRIREVTILNPYYMTTLNFIEGESEFFKKIQILNHSLIL